MRKLSKLLSLLLALALILSLPAAALAADREELEDTMTGNPERRVDVVEVDGRDCFMYVPQSPRVGNLLQEQNCFFVFGNSAFADEDEVMQFAIDSGIADVADREGVCALFLNPLTTWDEEPDATALISAAYQRFSVWPNLAFVEGVANGFTHPETQGGAINNGVYPPLQVNRVGDFPKYPGGFQHTYFFGYGAGADFIMEEGMVPVAPYVNYAYQTILATQYGTGKPAAVFLSEPSVLTNGNDDGIPMVIVNGPDGAADTASSWGGANSAAIDDDDFTAEEFMDIYDSIINVNSSRFWYKGIAQLNDTYTWVDEQGKEHDLEYYVFIPESVDLNAEKSAPLLVWCHGNDGEAEFMGNMSGWIDKAGKEGFIVISLDQHNSHPAEQIMNLIDGFAEEYPCVDLSRLYYGGFSMGSMKTWAVAVPNWNRFAAIIPNAGGANALGGNTAAVPGSLLPVFYIGGGAGLGEVGASFANSGKLVWSMNYINDGAFPAQDMTAYGDFGVESDTFEEYNTPGTDNYLKVYGYESVNGVIMTWLAASPTRAHSLTATDPDIVWEYIKGFSRDEDGNLYLDGELVPKDWPTITTQPVNFTGDIGDQVTFTVAAEGNNVKYQWEVNDGTGWKASGSGGNKTETMRVNATAARATYSYRCAVSEKDGGTVYTSPVQIILNAPTVRDAANFSGYPGDTASFHVTATGEGLKYQWQVTTDNGATWVNSGSRGNKTDTLYVPMTVARLSYGYRCVVTNKNHISVTSNVPISFWGMTFGGPAKMTVKAPTITTQPVNSTAGKGETAQFTVAATGYGVKYQWQVSTDGGTTWVNSGSRGNKTDTLSVPVTNARLSYFYRCVITDKANNRPVNSSVAQITPAT